MGAEFTYSRVPFAGTPVRVGVRCYGTPRVTYGALAPSPSSHILAHLARCADSTVRIGVWGADPGSVT